MRTLRLTIAGTVVLSLLGGLGAAAAVAQSEGAAGEEPRQATRVSGTQTFAEYVDEPTITTVGEVEQTCDWRAEYVMEMSDPRVSGAFTVLGYFVEPSGTGPRDADAGQGSVQLVNETGTWSGTWSSAYHPTSGEHTYVWLEGEGAYEGLTFWSNHCSRQVHSPQEQPIDGVIFEGIAPPMPQLSPAE